MDASVVGCGLLGVITMGSISVVVIAVRDSFLFPNILQSFSLIAVVVIVVL